MKEFNREMRENRNLYEFRYLRMDNTIQSGQIVGNYRLKKIYKITPRKERYIGLFQLIVSSANNRNE